MFLFHASARENVLESFDVRSGSSVNPLSAAYDGSPAGRRPGSVVETAISQIRIHGVCRRYQLLSLLIVLCWSVWCAAVLIDGDTLTVVLHNCTM